VTENPYPFDTVVIRSPEGDRSLTVEEFMALPFHVRIRHVLQSDLHFFAAADEIDLRQALAALRRHAAQTIV
jgi:hypothetical protein